MICLDTAIVIWAIQGIEDPQRPDMPLRARRFIENLSEAGVRIMIPSPVVHEFLTGLPTEVKSETIEVLSKMFYIPSFDLSSAVLAAELDANRGEMKEIKSDYGLMRQQIKVDTQIIAIAIMHQATEIVTDDVDHFTRIAKGRIKVSGLPEIPLQGDLHLNLNPGDDSLS